MATTTTGLIDTKIVVNAYGQSAGGVWPNMRVLIDGVEAGRTSVSTTSPNAYTFNAKVAPAQAHKVQIVYDNDGTTSGQDRNLGVKSVVVNGNTLNPTSASYDRDALDGQNVVAGQEGMWWNGALVFSTPATFYPAPVVTPPPAPTTGASTITVNAQAYMTGTTGAHFNLLIDGVKVGEGTATTTAKDYTFTTNAQSGVGHKVQVQYDNDAAGRDLLVNKVTINGKAVLPTAPIVTYDKGALDGKDVVAGQSGMWWNGTLVVNADQSYFPGTSTGPTNPPPGPTPTTPSLSVSDVTVREPGATAGGGSTITGFLHTEGNQIVDAAGNNVKLTGVNWFGGEGYNFVPTGLWADSYQGHLEKMKGLGFNVLRLPFSDAFFDSQAVTNGINYGLNPDLAGLTRLQVFDKIIDYAGKIGMKVILDHHRNSDGAGTNTHGLWYTDQYPESKVIANWKFLADHYKGNTTVIGADLHNEPNGPATWGSGNMATDWAAAAERIGNAIQTVNTDWLLLVEGLEWSSQMRGVANRQIDFNVDGKLVYSPHVYAHSVYEFDWLKASNYPNNLPSQYDGMWGYIYKNDIAPVLIGEFGGLFTNPAETAWGNSLIKYMNGDWNLDGRSDIAAGDQGMSWTYWAWTPESHDVGGLLNADYKTINQAKANLLKPGVFTGSTTQPGQTDAVFTVKLSAASTQTVKVNFATVDGTAKAGSDYTAANGTLTFNPGETTKTVTVKVLGDSVAEGSETFSLKLSAPTSATLADDTGVGTISQATAAAAAQADVYTHLVAQAAAAPATTLVDTAVATQTMGMEPVVDAAPLGFNDYVDPYHLAA